MTPDTERFWIEWIARHEGRLDAARFPVGIGDDAAVWRPRRGCDVVLTVDAQAEGTHFQRGWLSAREIGARAVSACVSDLAAMGARPGALLVAILAPRDFSSRSFQELYRGVHAAARRYGAPIAGGNLSRGPLSVTVTAAGEIERGRAVLRSGLRLGDQLWVTGAPGLARLGLMALQRKLGAGQTSPQLRRAVAAFRRPTARLTEARYLSRRWLISAMIDLSDGLGRDLGHLLAASSQASGRPLGAILDDDAFRGIRPLDAAARAAGLSPSSVAIAGGEDYEILFAAPPSRTASRQRRVFVRRHAVDLTRIGEVVAMRGLWLRRVDGELEAIKADSSFAHFGS